MRQIRWTVGAGALVAAAAMWGAAGAGAATPASSDFFSAARATHTAAFETYRRGSRRYVRHFAIQLGSGCNRGVQTANSSMRVSRSGRFSRTLRAGIIDFELRGRFTSRRRARGTYRIVSRFGSVCDSGRRAWRASAVDHAEPVVGGWGGTVAGSTPLSFRVSVGGHVVGKVEGQTPSNSCRSGPTDLGPSVQTAIVRPDGSFRLPLTIDPAFFAGRFSSRRSASGQLLAVTSQRKTADGRVVEQCDSGIVPWTARRR